MSELRLVKTLKDEYTVEVISRRYDQSTHHSWYREKYVESDELTNLLAYAVDHKWDLESDSEECRKTLSERLHNEIFHDVALSDEDRSRIEDNINYLVNDLLWHVEGYLFSIKISKDYEIYELQVTKEDLQQIFLS